MLAALPALLAVASPNPWRTIASGLDYALFTEADLHVVRIDPKQATLALIVASARDGQKRTTAEWCRAEHMAVAINAGMFQEDHRSNVGHLRAGDHVNNASWRSDYQSVLLLTPGSATQPPALFLNRDRDDVPSVTDEYGGVVQNLRLIARRENRWKQSEKRWSEAAVASTRDGRVLFLFSRTGRTMHDFNKLLLRLPLGVENAMHVEGGPEASLSIHAGGVSLDLAGSYETGFNENEDNRKQWPIPNVIGVISTRAR